MPDETFIDPQRRMQLNEVQESPERFMVATTDLPQEESAADPRNSVISKESYSRLQPEY